MERRLAAILAAEVVGYHRLTETDEPGTIARCKSHREELIDPAVTRHSGRIAPPQGDTPSQVLNYKIFAFMARASQSETRQFKS